MEKLLMIWDEADDLMAIAPRVLALVAAVGLVVAACFVNRLWPI